MRLGLFAIALVAAGIGAVAALWLLPGGPERLFAPSQSPRMEGKALIGGPFKLVDHTGKMVTEKDFAGRKMLVFFGFTHCPDICPSGLQVMSAALDQLGDKAGAVVPIFVTVDPERDTPEVMAKYVTSFHPRLVGLTGSQDAIKAAAKAYRVYYKKAGTDGDGANYNVDHTSIIYLMDERGQFVTHFTHPNSADKFAEQLARHL